MTETVIKAATEAAAEEDVAIDEELLEEAQRHLGTSSRNEAINAALREFVDQQRARRRRALENLQRMADEGVFDDSRLSEVDE
ncbi:type II toxin-antitoxin system VapB family antitoxin [Dactylosporangium sp. NPDC000521]|uniref:type II toxin-antitoxin system VapB family antitoxin n=1 Tax=Dactylosporangium sp. NPDC000521 TaxID=3363975 RepID=UPI0036B79146